MIKGRKGWSWNLRPPRFVLDTALCLSFLVHLIPFISPSGRAFRVTPLKQGSLASWYPVNHIHLLYTPA